MKRGFYCTSKSKVIFLGLIVALIQLLASSTNAFSQRQNLLFEETFEEQDFAKNWNWLYDCCGYAIRQSGEVVRSGSNASRFESRNNDLVLSNTVRLTIAKQVFSNVTDFTANLSLKVDRWIGLSVFIPSDFSNSSSTEPIINWQEVPENAYWQWIDATLGLNTVNGKWSFDRFGEKHDLGTINKGTWSDWVFHIRFSDQNDGLIEIWQNGSLLKQINGRTANTSKTASWLVAGLTKSPTSASRVMYIDELRIGNENAGYNDVVPGTSAVGVNQPPVAKAGNDQVVALPATSTKISGSKSYDPDGSVAKYEWSQVSGPSAATISNPADSATTANNLVLGTYEFKLVVTDNNDATSSDIVSVTVSEVANQAPVANINASATAITLPVSTVTLNGAASYDADGTINSYAWSKISGPTQFAFANAGATSTAVNNLAQGTYVFQLTVTDNKGAKTSKTISIQVNAAVNVAPVANITATATSITLPVSTVTLNGTGSYDSDGTINSYAWTRVSGPTQFAFASAAASSTVVNNLAAGTYIFELAVTDNKGAKATSRITIIVNAVVNQLPVSKAGTDQTIKLPVNSVSLSGSASYDNDGSISSYVWTKTSGPAGETIVSASSVNTKVNGLVQGTYVFQLTVTDNAGAKATDAVTVIVQAATNQAPIAKAGSNQTITLPVHSVTLSSTGSSDPDGTISTYTWSKVSGPASGTIVNATSASTAINNLTQGTYVFQLTVKDNGGLTATASVTVTVNAAVNKVPIAKAGNNQTIVSPVNSVSLSGAGSYDSDGTITAYAWTKLSGPAQGTIASPGTVTTSVTGLAEGTYVFQLKVTDNNGATAVSSVTIQVNASVAAPNELPVSVPGDNQSVTLLTAQALLDGSESYDTDGTITAYAWKQVSGPSTAAFSSVSTAQSTVTNLVAGDYVFELTVTDDKNATATNTITISVINTFRPTDQMLSVFPNPAKDVLNITFENSTQSKLQIMIFDLSGRRMQRLEMDKLNSHFVTSINISSLIQGAYILQVVQPGGKKMTTKFIKQ